MAYYGGKYKLRWQNLSEFSLGAGKIHWVCELKWCNLKVEATGWCPRVAMWKANRAMDKIRKTQAMITEYEEAKEHG